MRKQAIIAVEARGQALNVREDANISLVQAGGIAARLVRSGFDVAIRLIIDAAQSVEEYTVLGHMPAEFHEAWRQQIESASNKREARYALVREAREAYLPVTISCDQVGAAPIEDRLFFTALLARISGVNDKVIAGLRTASHPLIDSEAVDAYEASLRRHVGRAYLDLEESIACEVLRRYIGDGAESVSIETVSRPAHDPALWLGEEEAARIIQEDLAAKERGEGEDDFQTRLIGLFPMVNDPDEDRPYFNSPTCCRYEHGKVRMIARDRYSVLGLRASERMKFPAFRELIERQDRGSRERLIGLKYPYAARHIVSSLVKEALQSTREDAAVTKLIFVEGIEGEINAATGGLIDRELTARLWGTGVEYHRVFARRGTRELLPNLPGGLPLIADSFSHTLSEMLPVI